MTIVDDIVGENYKKLIDYAFKTSDSVMLVSVDTPPVIEIAEEQANKIKKIMPYFEVTREIFAQWRKKQWQDMNDTYVFKEKLQPFIKQLSPYLIKTRNNTEWPSTKILQCNSTYTIALYRICQELKQLLLEPSSYLSWRYPRYPEDLSFFKDNRCWLYASSHEEYIEFLPRSLEEYDFVASLGVELPELYRPIEDDEYYWEDYSL